MFQKSILDRYLNNLNELEVTKAFSNLNDFFNSIKNIKEAKEEQYQSGFLNDFFVKALGYTLFPKESYNLTTELKNESDSKKADGAILKDNKVVAIIELKSTKTKSMDKIVNQAFTYKNNHPTCKYVITSNFEKLRLYIEYSNEFIEFNLFHLTFENFKVIYLLLNKENLLNDLAKKIKEESKQNEESITNIFYKEYSRLRIGLFENLKANNKIDETQLLKVTQKLLDRFIFIFFAEDKYIIDNKTTQNLLKFFREDIEERDLYHFVKVIFKAIDKGNKKLNISAYNGGLFREDELLDSLIIDNKILEEVLTLEKYDFDSEIDVNILGHIFENSLSDLEDIRAKILNEKVEKSKSKRKKDGVFYTPSYITHYIVENTLGKICSDKKEKLGLINLDIKAPKNYKKLTKRESELKDKLESYREFLLGLTILDPACGSGAFLNEAFNFLMSEHDFITENEKILFGGGFFGFTDVDTQILEKNLFGVDINEEAIEIARLSLWLKTAKQGRKLTNLNEHIKVGNSLIDDKEVDSKAFKWEEEFKEVFNNGGFDVVIGNPPYVRQEAIKHLKPHLHHYKVYSGTADLYVYFYELAYKLLRENGLNGFICSNKFFRAKYGENLRSLILENMSIDSIVDFNKKQIFEEATVDSSITIFKKSKNSNSFKYFPSDMIEFFEINQSDLSKDSFSFSNPKELKIKNKIEKVGVPLKEWNILIKSGIKTGLNEAFIIDEKTKNELIAKDSKNSEIIKPFLRGRDIKRYHYEFANLWLVNIHNNPPIDINEYPIIKKHLDKYYDKLEKRSDKGVSSYNLRNCAYLNKFEEEKILWLELVDKPSFTIDNNNFYLDMTIFFISGKNLKYLLSILNSNLIFWYFDLICAESGVGTNRWKKMYVEQLPIPKIDETQQKPFIEKADLMLQLNEEFTNIKNEFLNELQTHYNLDKLSKKLENFQTLTFEEFIKEVIKIAKLKLSTAKERKEIKNYWSELFEEESQKLKELQDIINKTDSEIDKMVYELYGLSEDEIRVIEGEND